MNPSIPSNQIDLSSLCKAAVCKDRAAIASYLQEKIIADNDGGNGCTTTTINKVQQKQGSRISRIDQNGFLNSSSSTYGSILLHYVFYNPTANASDKNATHNDNDDRDRRCEYATFLKYFTNVHFIPPIPEEGRGEGGLHHNDGYSYDQDQKLQLSMSIRSLLLLPWNTITPWDTIKSIVNLLITTQHQQQENEAHINTDVAFEYNMVRDPLFALGIFNHVKEFLDHFQKELYLLCSPSPSPSPTPKSIYNDQNNDSIHGRIDHSDNIMEIEEILHDLVSCMTKSLFIQHENSGDRAKALERNRGYDGQDHLVTLLFEIVILFVETGKSIEIHHHQIYKESFLDMKEDVPLRPLVDVLFASRYHHNILRSNGIETEFIIKLDYILPLLALSGRIGGYMNHGHWESLRKLVNDGLHFYHDTILLQSNHTGFHVVDIFEAILSILTSVDYDDDYEGGYNHVVCPSWTKILLDLYSHTRNDQRILRMIEFKLQEFMTTILPNACDVLIDEILKIWKGCMDDHNNQKSEVETNILKGACLNCLFIMLHSQREEYISTVSHLLSESIDEPEILQASKVMDALLSMAHITDKFLIVNDDIDICVGDFQSFFHAVHYTNNGCVDMIDKDTALASHNMILTNFQNAVNIVYISVSFYRTSEQMRHTNPVCQDHALDRVQEFLEVAQWILETNGYNTLDPNKLLFGVAVLVTLFEEVFSLRPILLQRIVEIVGRTETNFKNREYAIDPRLVYCWAISCINIISIQNISGNRVQETFNRESLHDYFKPLCQLLSTVAGKPLVLPSSVRSELISMLSFVPQGREVIINIARQSLKSVEVAMLKCRDELFDDQERILVAIESFFILIKEKFKGQGLTDVCTLDEVGLDSLLYLCNIIALNRPLLSSQNRSFVFANLEKMVESNSISIWVAERILAATLRALLPHFCSSSSDRLIFTPLCERNNHSNLHTDVPSLIMIATLLTQYRPSEWSNQNFTVEEIDALVPIKRIPQLSVENDNKATLRSIALACVGAIIVYVKHDSPNIDSRIAFQNMDTSTLQEKICKLELSAIDNIVHSGKLLSPQAWYDYCNIQVQKSQTDQKPKTLQSFTHTTFDCLMGMLMNACDTILPIDHQFDVHDRTIDRMLSLLASIGSLQHVHHEYLQSSSVDTLHLSQNILCRTTIVKNFFLHSIDAFKHILKEKNNESKGLNRIELLVQALTDFCNSMQSYDERYNCCDENFFINQIESIQAMWSFYVSCCNEIKCCDLIDFIEARSESYLADTSSTDEVFASTESIYEFIRKYRSAFISCFGNYFQFLEINGVWKRNEGRYFLFCMQCACILPQDLSSSMSGLGGGITRHLYRCYVQIVEDAVKACQEISTLSVVRTCVDIDNDLFQYLNDNCVSASAAIWKVACEIEMKAPFVFKANLRMNLIHLPQLYRKLEFVTIMLKSPNRTVDTDSSDSLVEIKATTIMIESIMLLDNFRKRRGISDDTDMAFKSILSSNKKLLEWSLETSIIAVEKLWTEPWQFLEGSNPADFDCEVSTTFIHRHNSFELFPATKDYAAKRLAVTSNSLSAITSLLSLGQHAGTLPLTVERRLFPCLERIFVTLKTHVRFITKQMEVLKKNPQAASNMHLQMSMAESISCMIAWLTNPDLTVKSWKYQTTLPDSKTSNNNRRQHENDDTNHPRMIKIVQRIEELENSLNQLTHKLSLPNHVGHDLDRITEQLTHKDLTVMQVIDDYRSCCQSNKAVSYDAFQTHKTFKRASNLKKRLKEAQKDKKRSKNSVVNEWMYLDCELDETCKADDDFDDLEDFILPG